MLNQDSSLFKLLVDFDFDRYTTPYIPRNRISKLPRPISHFLGYRPQPSKEPPALIQWISMFIATVAGLCVVSATYVYAPGLHKYNPPVIVASLGATAVLDYNTIRSPLSQPRNTIIGHTLSAIIGVAVAKLFQLSPNFAQIDWVAAAVGCACANVVMSMMGCIHPPGGATAVLASTTAQIVAMGWWFVPFVLLATCEMVGVALLINNVARHYPMYWWTANDCGYRLPGHQTSQEEKDAEHAERGDAGVNKSEDDQSDRTLEKELGHNLEFISGIEEIHILPYKVQMPPHIHITDEEAGLLEKLQERIRMHKEMR